MSEMESAKNENIEFYREKIVEMVNEIQNQRYLEKIYNYITVPYSMCKSNH